MGSAHNELAAHGTTASTATLHRFCSISVQPMAMRMRGCGARCAGGGSERASAHRQKREGKVTADSALQSILHSQRTLTHLTGVELAAQEQLHQRLHSVGSADGRRLRCRV